MTKPRQCAGGTVIWTDSGCVWWKVIGARLVPVTKGNLPRVEDAMVPKAARHIARELVRAADLLDRQEKRRKAEKARRKVVAGAWANDMEP